MNNTTSEDGQYTFDQNAANKLPVSGMDGLSKEQSATIVRHMGTILVIVMSPASGSLL